MVLTKYFSLFGLSISLWKKFFIFKCGCLSGSSNLNLHLEIALLKTSRACKNFKIFCPSVLTIVALYCDTLVLTIVALKQVHFFH